MKRSLNFITVLGLCAALAACAQVVGKEASRRISGPAFMTDRQMKAGDFVLTVYERIHDRGGNADLYIEGDNEKAEYDPFPEDLVALNLASRDKAKNLIYLTRPCQFRKHKPKWGTPWSEDIDPEEICDKKYLTTHRFAPEVIQSYHIALDELKKRWGIKKFRLYGHSGGGAIAALLAHDRDDILSLVTVSGLMDSRAFEDAKPKTKYQKYFLSPLTGSVNAADIAYSLRKLPQHHYLGGVDETMPAAALLGYLENIGPTNCVYYTMIQENGYASGWVEKWPEILKDHPTCQGPRKSVLIDHDVLIDREVAPMSHPSPMHAPSHYNPDPW